MRRLLTLFLAAIVAGCLFLTLVPQGFSWYTVERSKEYIGQIASSEWIENERVWHQYDRRLTKAVDFGSVDAYLYWQLGEMHRLRAAGLRLWPDLQREEWKIAKQHYDEAVVLGPNDCALLSRIAQRLAYMDDLRAVDLMRRCLAIAPYEPVVQYQLADVGIRLWEELDSDLRRSFKSMLAAGMKQSRLAGALKEMGKRNGRQDIVSALIEGSR